MTNEIQKLFQQSAQCFMGRPDYDFSFFLTDDFFACKKKNQNKKKQQQQNSKRLWNESVRNDRSWIITKQTPTIFCVFQQSKSQPTALIQCRISFLLTQEFTACNNNFVRNKAEILLTWHQSIKWFMSKWLPWSIAVCVSSSGLCPTEHI